MLMNQTSKLSQTISKHKFHKEELEEESKK